MRQFTSEKWNRDRRQHMGESAPLSRHMQTKQFETGFEELTDFVPASVVGDLMAVLFEKGILSIEELRKITGNDTLAAAEDDAA